MKITCGTCKNEKNNYCNKKKVGVKLNKRRNCDKYELQPDKVKARQILKTTRLPYAEKEALRQEYKEQLKQLKARMKEQRTGVTPSYSGDPKHPLTGDLSRFTSTAGEKNDG